ncbi:MAG: chromosomal replication initiator DnaA [Pseudomonadota bacterium]
MPEQLGFNLPAVPALERADFLVAPSNAIAVAMIETWHDWSPRKLVLCGPEGAGKTHLTHVWAALSDASIMNARDLPHADVALLAQGNVAVENIPEISGHLEAQTALFHMHNLVLAEGHALLLTGAGNPRSWGLELPDLASRIEGTQTAVLNTPDDALLAAVIAKMLADRQLTPKPDLIPYLVARIDRSFAAARDIVARIDAASLAQKRAITRNLAATVLDKQRPDAR